MKASGNIAFGRTCQQNAGATAVGGDVIISQKSITYHTTYHFSQEKPDGQGAVRPKLQLAGSLDKEYVPMKSFGSDKAKYPYRGAQMDEEHTGTPYGEKPTPRDGKKKKKYFIKALAYLSAVFVQAWIKYSATTSVVILLL